MFAWGVLQPFSSCANLDQQKDLPSPCVILTGASRMAEVKENSAMGRVKPPFPRRNTFGDSIWPSHTALTRWHRGFMLSELTGKAISIFVSLL